ncbi:MAG: hypothetical protein ACK559_02510, partial [bacterium]
RHRAAPRGRLLRRDLPVVGPHLGEVLDVAPDRGDAPLHVVEIVERIQVLELVHQELGVKVELVELPRHAHDLFLVHVRQDAGGLGHVVAVVLRRIEADPTVLLTQVEERGAGVGHH